MIYTMKGDTSGAPPASQDRATDAPHGARSGLRPVGSVSTGAVLGPLPRVTTRVARCTYDLWPPEVQAEMRAIWEGDGQ